MASIVFLIMAGKEIGAGHYKRSQALKNEFKSHNVSLYILDLNRELDIKELVGKVLFDYDELFDILVKNRPEMLIVDMPIRHYNHQVLKKIREKLIKVVLIDDDKECSNEEIYDLMFACSMRFHNILSTNKICYGPKYMIINPSFSSFINSHREVTERIQKVLLSFGGSDPNNITSQVLDYINSSKLTTGNLHISVILGQFAEDISRVFTLKGNHDTSFYRNVTDMPNRLWDTDLAIISGGMTLYEACCTGTPTITINQTDEQNAEAEIFDQLNSVYNLGKHNQISVDDFNRVMELLDDKSKRIILSNSAKQQIDGEGIERIKKKISFLLNSG